MNSKFKNTLYSIHLIYLKHKTNHKLLNIFLTSTAFEFNYLEVNSKFLSAQNEHFSYTFSIETKSHFYTI